MFIVKKTGLVPVTDGRNASVYGVTPAQAREMLKKGLAELFPIPEGIETIEVADSVAPRAPAAAVEEPIVEIPEDWATLHHLQKVKLAKAIAGDGFIVPEGQKPAEVAEQVISDEVQRRAAAATDLA
ncbi:hypothetical protein NKJ09_22765 [Mesorhizobium sp. M0189]|uniref:hypothetical protein n=1 Tax=Mesorhizobium sp. M0189 TaxID=2956909 RepID=UPI00333B3904